MIHSEDKYDSVNCKIVGTGKAILNELTAVIQSIYEADKETGVKIIMYALNESGFMEVIEDLLDSHHDDIDNLIEAAMKEARGE